MNTETPSSNSIPGLLRELRDETTTLLRQEVALAKSEMKANVSRMGGHAVQIAIGGFVAYAGVIVLLIGIGHLLGALLIRAGLDEQVAQWLAPSIVGLVVAIIGWLMLSKAKNAIAHDDLAPKQTIDSLRENKDWAQNKLHPLLMNESAKNDETETIRTDIDLTRRRMDDTMDALGDRLQPRHLLDELLGFLRGSGSDGESRMKHLGQRVGHSCNTAMHSVVDSVKQNPMPAVLIGAGVAWMIYSSRRDQSQNQGWEDYSASDAARRYDPDTHFDRPLDYPAGSENVGGWSGQSNYGAGTSDGSGSGEVKTSLGGKVSSAADQVKGKLSQAGEAARERMGALRNKAGEVTERLREGTRETYSRTRERVSTTANQHPLEVGLVALAAGLLAGLAVPTPNVINRSVGPTADRLRERTREAGSEMLEKGKRVAQAAVSAVTDEAQAQGLTPERLREKAAAVAEKAKDAGQQAASREGITESKSANNPSGSNPTAARPGM